jgi:hypothetical protein
VNCMLAEGVVGGLACGFWRGCWLIGRGWEGWERKKGRGKGVVDIIVCRPQRPGARLGGSDSGQRKGLGKGKGW